MDRPAPLRILLADRSGTATSGEEGGGSARLGRLARSLRDAGHEVVLLGPVGSMEAVEAVAVQEDVDATCVWDGSRVQVADADDAARSGLEALVAEVTRR